MCHNLVRRPCSFCFVQDRANSIAVRRGPGPRHGNAPMCDASSREVRSPAVRDRRKSISARLTGSRQGRQAPRAAGQRPSSGLRSAEAASHARDRGEGESRQTPKIKRPQTLVPRFARFSKERPARMTGRSAIVCRALRLRSRRVARSRWRSGVACGRRRRGRGGAAGIACSGRGCRSHGTGSRRRPAACGAGRFSVGAGRRSGRGRLGGRRWRSGAGAGAGVSVVAGGVGVVAAFFDQ